jgi:hypothetical protein
MRYRKLSPTGDYTWGQSLLNFWIDVPEAVGQAIQTSFLLWQGEWFLDTTVGTPWITGVLGYHSQANADTTLEDVALNVQGVVDIKNFQSTLDGLTRKYSCQFNVDTVYGPTTVDIQNFINF